MNFEKPITNPKTEKPEQERVTNPKDEKLERERDLLRKQWNKAREELDEARWQHIEEIERVRETDKRIRKAEKEGRIRKARKARR